MINHYVAVCLVSLIEHSLKQKMGSFGIVFKMNTYRKTTILLNMSKEESLDLKKIVQLVQTLYHVNKSRAVKL